MFRPNLYHTPPDHPDPDPGSTNVGAQQTPSVLKRVWRGLKRVFNALNPFGIKALNRRPDTPRTSQTVGSKAAQFKTNHLEVWFSGCHSGMYPCPPFQEGGGSRMRPVIACKSLMTQLFYPTDIGGGNTEDIDDSTDRANPALSNISLRWMVRQVAAVRAKCPIHFDEATLKLWNIPREDIQVQPIVTEGLPVAHYFSDDDARADRKDELKRSRFWYVVEILPTYYEWQDERGQWFKQVWQVIRPVFRIFRNRAD